jgi:cation:H+ antiporter
MLPLLNVILIVSGSFLLILSVRLFISSTSKIAHYFNLSGYTVSFLLVAFATSLPELSVSVTSALNDAPLLAYGNVLGSNIALLTLVAALPGIFGRGLPTSRMFKSKDIYFTLFFSLLAVALSVDKVIGRVDGMVLILGYLIYVASILRPASLMGRIKSAMSKVNVWKQFVLFGLSLGILLFSSNGIVTGAVGLAEQLNLEVVFIGLTLMALGTSLPEIAFVLSEVRRRQKDEILGDIVGSVVANTTLVLGVAAVLRPIELSLNSVGGISLGFLLVSLVVFYIFSRTRKRIDTRESFILLLLYILFILAEFHTGKV